MMLIPDVNVLVTAFNADDPRSARTYDWLKKQLQAPEVLGIWEVTLSSLIRIVTNPRVAIESGGAFEFASALRDHPRVVRVSPTPSHWPRFLQLCRVANARGPLVPDAYLAALAMDWEAELITFDRDFARFPGLRTRPAF